MRLLPTVRSVLVRHPLLWWAAIAVLAGTTGVVAAGALRRVDEARRSWGSSRPVWVATAAASPGERLVVERRDYPLAVVPTSAVTSSPAGAVAHDRVEVGEVVVAADVSTAGAAGLIPSGSVAIAVTAPSPQLHAGDRVAAFANGERLADGTVIAVDEEQVVVAIPAAGAAALALAVPGDGVVLALLPPP